MALPLFIKINYTLFMNLDLSYNRSKIVVNLLNLNASFTISISLYNYVSRKYPNVYSANRVHIVKRETTAIALKFMWMKMLDCTITIAVCFVKLPASYLINSHKSTFIFYQQPRVNIHLLFIFCVKYVTNVAMYSLPVRFIVTNKKHISRIFNLLFKGQ